MLFDLQPPAARVNDSNAELINVYQTVARDVEGLIECLSQHRNEPEYFYSIRAWDRNREQYARRSDTERASRILYLNKTCYNGLFRVNAAGHFNTPFGRYNNPNLVNADALRALSAYLREARVQFSSTDYAAVLEELPKGTFVYLDPPYHPVSATANFTSYTRGGFDEAEQIRLKECCDRMDERGIRFMLSNSAAPFIVDLYRKYHVATVRAKRAINSVATGRGDVDEVVVRNYG